MHMKHKTGTVEVRLTNRFNYALKRGPKADGGFFHSFSIPKNELDQVIEALQSLKSNSPNFARANDWVVTH